MHYNSPLDAIKKERNCIEIEKLLKYSEAFLVFVDKH